MVCKAACGHKVTHEKTPLFDSSTTHAYHGLNYQFEGLLVYVNAQAIVWRWTSVSLSSIVIDYGEKKV
jgi:hypothetical protein